MHGKVLLITDIVEIEHHGHAEELVAHLAHNGSATCNNGLGEMVVQRYTGVAQSQRSVAIDDERRQRGDMEQPSVVGHIVIGVAATNADVRHLELHLLHECLRAYVQLFALHGSFLPLTRDCQEETASRAPLDVTLRERSRIGETTVVEGVESVKVQRLLREQACGQLDTPPSFGILPSREVVGILVDDVEAEATAIGVDVQLVVIVFAQ